MLCGSTRLRCAGSAGGAVSREEPASHAYEMLASPRGGAAPGACAVLHCVAGLLLACAWDLRLYWQQAVAAAVAAATRGHSQGLRGSGSTGGRPGPGPGPGPTRVGGPPALPSAALRAPAALLQPWAAEWGRHRRVSTGVGTTPLRSRHDHTSAGGARVPAACWFCAPLRCPQLVLPHPFCMTCFDNGK
jgi:hypothetical protein